MKSFTPTFQRLKKFFRFFKASFKPFSVSPLRTGLALLGILFGVAAVVSMISIGEGAQKQIIGLINSLGADVVQIVSLKVDESLLAKTINQSQGLSRKDVASILQIADTLDAESIAYSSQIKIFETSVSDDFNAVEVHAVNQTFLQINRLELAWGRPFNDVDFNEFRSLAIIGHPIAQMLFPKNPQQSLGQYIQLNHTYWQVIGIISTPENQAQRDLSFAKEDSLKKYSLPKEESLVLIPSDSAFSKLRPAEIYSELDRIMVKVGSIEETVSYKTLFERILARTHSNVKDYEILAPEEILKQKQETQRILNIVLLSIAAISLLVGGVGIMNIMLANVLERIKEIGIRRAVGATQRAIMLQFLFESVSICLLGGIAGIVLGLIISAGVSLLTDIPTAFSFTAILLSFVIAVGTGVVFGILPAYRAARINPVEALHRE